MKKWLRRAQDKREKSFISIVITLAIVLMLILSGPANAVQVSVNATRLDNIRVGETGSFYVNITIGANERVPITNISIEGLPEIDGSPGGILVFNVSDFDKTGDFKIKGNYNISLIEQHGLVKGFGYGYGYVNNSGSPPYSGYGDSYQFYGYGYGYGYDSGSSTSYTKLVYKIAVNTTGAEAKQYEAAVRVNAGDDVTGRSVVFEDSLSFSLQPASPHVQAPGSPAITGFAPETSPVMNFIGEPRKFSITANQTVNVTWYINGTEVFSQTGTNESSYTNNSAAPGTWIVNATARNANGTVSREWTWIVIEPPSPARIHASVEIKPDTLNLASKGKFKAFITLGEGYSAADIDPGTVICEGAHAIKWKISKKNGGTLIVTFNRQDLVNVSAGDDVALRVTGELFDGTPFEGSDTIRVIDRGKKHHHDDEFEEDEEHEYSESGNHYIDGEQKHHKEVDGRTHGKGKKKDKK